MALTELTGYDDSSSDDGENGERSDQVENREQDEQENNNAVELSAKNLEEHNKNADVLQQCSSGDAKTEVSSQVGAGLLFGLPGLFLGGPILALLTGGGTAYLASSNSGPVGDAARASGDFAVETGSRVAGAAKEADENLGILEKIKNAFSFGWSKARQFDEEHKATERLKETMSDVTQKTVELEQKHHLMENVLEGIQNGVNVLLEKLRNATQQTSVESCNSDAASSVNS